MIQSVVDPLGNGEISKETIGMIVIGVDLLVIVTILVYSMMLQNSLQIYTSQFKDQTIEMSDFTISMSNLPLEHMYGDNDDVLRAFLTKHFESVIKNEMKKTG